jgi:hypothetical protein
VVLPDDFGKRLGTVFSGKNSVAHAATLPASQTGIQQDFCENPGPASLFPDSANFNRRAGSLSQESTLWYWIVKQFQRFDLGGISHPEGAFAN